jgi:hypothetical protein
MISFRALGRQQFGNQLFQYAFLRTTARRLGVRFYCPDWRGTGLLQLEDDNERELRPDGVDKTYVEPASYFGLNPNALAITDGTDVYGFFQTEQYWQDADSVRRWFRFREDRTARVRDKYKSIGGEDVGLHVRLTDKTTVEGRIRYYTPGVRYYDEALRRLGPRERVLVFSDDIAGARRVLHGLRANLLYVEGNEDYEDLYLMTRCRDFICSVSTFAWWGAWLGENPGRKVVCPAEGPTRPGCEAQNRDYWPAPWTKVRALRGLIQDARVVRAVERGKRWIRRGFSR